MIKTLLRYAAYGFAIGCIQLIVALLILDTFRPDVYYIFMQNFTAIALGGLPISTMAFVGAITYKFDRLNFGLQIILHAAIVLAVAVPIAFGYGLFSPDSPTTAVTIGILAWVVLLVLIWLGFYLHDNSKVKKINDKLKQRDD